ncbi:MAG: 2-hydroxyacyl-CoA dehydratase family protein [Candidatus Geothermincolia bacterium]
MFSESAAVGITTTVPIEVLLAAGLSPVDLNNIFVSDASPDSLVDSALAEGFPQNSCAWLKGIFGAVMRDPGITRVVGVVRGDCSGTELLLEALESRGLEVIPFTYPYPPARRDVEREILRLCDRVGTTMAEAEAWREKLAAPRALLGEIDRECWEGNRVTGAEAHLWLVGSSDFNRDVSEFSRGMESFLAAAREREPLDGRQGIPFGREVRLGYIGVPPITPGIFDLAESLGARFVFHEVQRQFAMPPDAAPDESGHVRPARDVVEQYMNYTYPYTVARRARDINLQAAKRRLDGIVHYVQSFCHRNLEDVVFRRLLEAPMLTLECDCPGGLGASARARLENFVQVLGENQ